MTAIAAILVSIVATLHLGFMVLEMLLWTRPIGRRIFKTSPSDAETMKVLAANQGLYNGFLAAGLIWSLLHPEPAMGSQIALFFLGCALVAGLFGGLTAKRSILFIQGVPALITALIVVTGVI